MVRNVDQHSFEHLLITEKTLNIPKILAAELIHCSKLASPSRQKFKDGIKVERAFAQSTQDSNFEVVDDPTIGFVVTTVKLGFPPSVELTARSVF